MNAKALGLFFGALFALGVFIATNWLVLKGGPIDDAGQEVVGPHLSLLGNFFLGYSVTFFGSLIGAAYGFAVGTITGTAIGLIYNKVVALASD